MKTIVKRGVGRPRKDEGETSSIFIKKTLKAKLTLIKKLTKVSISSITGEALEQYLERYYPHL